MEKPAVNSTVQLEITDLVYPGHGLARLDGLVVFVRGGLPGERVRARISGLRKNHAEAELEDVEKASPHRIAPACPLAERCPGCSYQHLNYHQEIRCKEQQLRELLVRLGGVENPVLYPGIPSPSCLGYRNRITLHAGSSPGSDRPLGYYGYDNREVFDVPACPLARREINQLLSGLRRDPEFRNSLRAGEAVLFRWTEVDGALWRRGKDPVGGSLLTEETVLGPVLVPPGSFFQVNIPLTNLLLQDLSDVISRLQPAAALDLYCGCGVFALAAGKAAVPAVLGIDRDREAVEAARKNARNHKLPGLQFEPLSAREGLKFGLAPLKPETTLLILDPPRSGLEKGIVDLIADSPPASLIYISCGPDTLARDVRRLAGAGYRIAQSRVYDMFPRTPHFESLTVLRQTRTAAAKGASD